MQRTRFRMAVLAVMLVSACGQLRVTDPRALYYVPPPGSQVVVKQRLEVPPGMTRVFLQHGNVIPKSARNDYAVNCNFEINTLGDAPRYIEPGTYTVTHSERRTNNIVSVPQPQQFASLLVAASMMERDDGTPLMFEELRFTLTSTPPSDVRELACRGVMDYPSEILPPTLAEVRRALGDYAEIRVPEEGSLIH